MPALWLPRETSLDFGVVDRDLRREDDRLFLSYEIDRRYEKPVYRVMCEVGGDRPPVCITEWRDELGRPLPLSSGILTRVRSQRARGGVAAQEAFAANEAMVERELRAVDEEMDEIAADGVARIRGRRSPAFHRGLHLRRSRQGR